MKAAVLHAYNEPLKIAEVQIDEPRSGEVLLRTAASGVCHSDLHIIEGRLPAPPPLVLGHEPAGIVERVGEDVTYVKPGDPVIACLSVFCGKCEYCTAGRPYLCGGAQLDRQPGDTPRLTLDGTPLYQMGQLASFAEKMLVPENSLVKIREDMPLDRAALIGCGVTTGLGAALNTARVRAGSTVAVIGCGGVGLSIIQGCRIAGAGRIIAVDTQDWKLELARTVGATDGVSASAGDAVAQVIELTGGGVEQAFEAIGLNATVQQALAMTRKGGTAFMVGVLGIGENIELPGFDVVINEKRIQGSMMGSNAFRIDMPRYVDFYLNGQLKLDEMISARRPLEEVNTCFDEMRKGTAARSVIVFD
ncbi:MAG: Zn-dependent alcohol dehydrogenase [Myxococcota bacterium]|jgi:S-(hydroxymethyl)glutathione dehydrogenase/alcohol dehydrogenase|nr:alcohol dehydrogenase [Deltaproteobacteria bacterium]MCP4241148.1 Zn-dependent alcohol dehydrogenase [bacterium]MDP6075140.1 Zn-dependent alcohol dehydrogenase [Myxococcota bacterium]MDP6242129.1 Zn-dependent alcohol dehydrogenase [Myxococcota bacterium]MDP7074750.1 Zn-dependent alcohol dehydrogenase [Myxococcota bacterium]